MSTPTAPRPATPTPATPAPATPSEDPPRARPRPHPAPRADPALRPPARPGHRRVAAAPRAGRARRTDQRPRLRPGATGAGRTGHPGHRPARRGGHPRPGGRPRTIDNGTAWLEQPDRQGESTHAFWPDPAGYARTVARLHAAGVPTATHAIGDAAVRYALDALEQAGARRGGPVRHRIEHIETVPDATVRRFAELGVTASMQPTHCCEYTRADHTDNWSRRLGEERASRAWRCRDLWEAGVRVALGSDWPIAPFAPLAVMAGARHRRPADLSLPPHGPAQALTPLQGYTLAPAWLAGEEELAGRLAVGYRADLTVFADDPLAVPDTELAGLPVLLTVLAGRPTHRAAALG
nr:amidohydrolase family protein [Streptomyces tateyamensis]